MVKLTAKEQIVKALSETLEMFERHPELKELDGSWPNGSVFGIVRQACERIEEAGL